MNTNRHIWEGWTAQMFIDDLTPMFDLIMNGRSWMKPFNNDTELKKWCMENQPYYKKHIPEVFAHFKAEMKKKL